MTTTTTTNTTTNTTVQVCSEAWQHAQQQRAGALPPQQEFVFSHDRYTLPQDTMMKPPASNTFTAPRSGVGGVGGGHVGPSAAAPVAPGPSGSIGAGRVVHSGAPLRPAASDVMAAPSAPPPSHLATATMPLAPRHGLKAAHQQLAQQQSWTWSGAQQQQQQQQQQLPANPQQLQQLPRLANPGGAAEQAASAPSRALASNLNGSGGDGGDGGRMVGYHALQPATANAPNTASAPQFLPTGGSSSWTVGNRGGSATATATHTPTPTPTHSATAGNHYTAAANTSMPRFTHQQHQHQQHLQAAYQQYHQGPPALSQPMSTPEAVGWDAAGSAGGGGSRGGYGGSGGGGGGPSPPVYDSHFLHSAGERGLGMPPGSSTSGGLGVVLQGGGAASKTPRPAHSPFQAFAFHGGGSGSGYK
jgi:hypothetical protein